MQMCQSGIDVKQRKIQIVWNLNLVQCVLVVCYFPLFDMKRGAIGYMDYEQEAVAR